MIEIMVREVEMKMIAGHTHAHLPEPLNNIIRYKSSEGEDSPSHYQALHSGFIAVVVCCISLRQMLRTGRSLPPSIVSYLSDLRSAADRPARQIDLPKRRDDATRPWERGDRMCVNERSVECL